MRLLLIVFFLLVSNISVGASDVVGTIDEFYKSLNTLEGNFVQKSTIKELKKTTTYNGRFYMKKGSLHIRYLGDKPHHVYINNNEMIIYKPSDKTAFKMPFDESKYGQTPLSLLGGLTDIRSDFNIKRLSDKKVSLTPVKGIGQIVNVEITVDDNKPFPIDTINMIDNSGNKIEVVFKDVVVNGKVDSKVFRFVPPEGTTILQ
ncbi:MAG: outer membrane lipoprotein carrier protein LolA [Thermodesulfovibrionales bacterium]